MLQANISAAQKIDTLAQVNLRSVKKTDITTTAVPVQIMGARELTAINSISVADAVKHFAGTVVKDYGGIGGLKTISVRSLGASHTGVMYNGIMLADAQGGQIDLGKFSLDNVDELQLVNGNPVTVLQTARAFSAASLLIIKTNTALLPVHTSQITAKLNAGSFGFIDPSLSFKSRTAAWLQQSAGIEYISANGEYRYRSYENSTQKSKRRNTDIKSLRAEYSAAFIINDSNKIHTDIYFYNSRRGLPGSVTLGNPEDSQRLNDKQFFLQAVWQNMLSAKHSILISAKFSADTKLYLDPQYPNSEGGLENDFHQQETYFSAAYNYKPLPGLSVSVASDFSSSRLKRTDPFAVNFSAPVRMVSLNNIAAQYKRERFELSGNLLYTYLDEKVKFGPAGKTISVASPAISASVQPFPNVPLRIRAFYKNIFRAPSFNDLYYTNIGNTNLRPEYVKQFNAGITYTAQGTGPVERITATADGYINTGKDIILAVPRTNLFQWTMLNVGKTVIHGIDAGLLFFLREWRQINISSRIAYTFQQASDVSDPASELYKTQLPYTPKHSGSAGLSIDYKKYSFSYNIIMSSYRYRLGEQTFENLAQGWATHDLLLRYSLPPAKNIEWKISAGLNNIYNNQYEIIKYYPMPGTSYRLGIIALIKQQHINQK